LLTRQKQNTAVAITAASRLVFAVARDGVLPFSSWVSAVHNGQPRNAVIVVWTVASIITCTLLPSAVAFTSLVSAAGVPSAAAYGLICLARLFLTPNRFPKPAWSLGRLSKPFQVIGVFWNGWVVAVLFSPYAFPVTGENLNCTFTAHPSLFSISAVVFGGVSCPNRRILDAPVIMAAVTIFALVSYFLMPEDAWLPASRISRFVDSKGVVSETVEEVDSRDQRKDGEESGNASATNDTPVSN
jgi:amino acid transporter